MKLYVILLSSFLFFSCATKTVTVEKPVYIKCSIPEIPPAQLEKVPENASYPEKLQVILNNCLKIKQENELLRKAMEVCR